MLLLRISFPLHLSSSWTLRSQQPSFTSSSFLHLSLSGLFYLHSKNSFHLRQTKCSIAFPSVAIKMRMGGKKNRRRETQRERDRQSEREKERKGGGSQSLNMSGGKRCLFEFLLPWWIQFWRQAHSLPPYYRQRQLKRLQNYAQERRLLTSAYMNRVEHLCIETL